MTQEEKREYVLYGRLPDRTVPAAPSGAGSGFLGVSGGMSGAVASFVPKAAPAARPFDPAAMSDAERAEYVLHGTLPARGAPEQDKGAPSGATPRIDAVDRSEHGNAMSLGLGDVPESMRDPLNIGKAFRNAYANLQESKAQRTFMEAWEAERAASLTDHGDVAGLERQGVVPLTPGETALKHRELAARSRGEEEKASGYASELAGRVSGMNDEAEAFLRAADRWRAGYDMPDSKLGRMILQAIESSGFTVESALRSGAAWALGGPVGGSLMSLMNTVSEAGSEAGEVFMAMKRAGRPPEEIQKAVDFVRSGNFAGLLASNLIGDWLTFGADSGFQWLAKKIAGQGALAKAGRFAVGKAAPYVAGVVPEMGEEGGQSALTQLALHGTVDPAEVKASALAGGVGALLYGGVGRGVRGALNVAAGDVRRGFSNDLRADPVTGVAPEAGGVNTAAQEGVSTGQATRAAGRAEGFVRAVSSETGDFGPIWEVPPRDSEGAIRLLMKQKAGEVQGAAFREDTGPIDFVYGVAGDPEREFGGGYGLAHIEAKHGPEAVAAVPKILRTGKIKHKGSRIEVHAPDGMSVVRLDWDGKAKTWLVTSYLPTTDKDPRPDRTSTIVGHEVGGSVAPPNEGLSENVTQLKTADKSKIDPASMSAAEKVAYVMEGTLPDRSSSGVTSVKEQIRGQLDDAAKAGGLEAVMGEDEKEAYSTLFSSMAEVAARRRGLSPEEWMKEKNLRIVADDSGRVQMWSGAEVMGQPLNRGVDVESGITGFVAERRFSEESARDVIHGKGRKAFEKSLAGTYVNEETGWNLSLSQTNVDHAISSAVRNKEVDAVTSMNILAELPKIIQHARLMESHDDVKQDEHVEKMHRFFVPSRIATDGAMYKVKLTVKQMKEGNSVVVDGIYRAHDTKVIEKVPGRLPRGVISKESPSNDNTPGTFEIILGPFLEGVKDSGGSPYVRKVGERYVARQSERGAGRLGFIARSGEGVDIGLTPRADRSTFLHEMGHLFLWDLEDATLGEQDVNPGTVRDYEVVQRWWRDHADWIAGWIRNGGEVSDEVRARFTVRDGSDLVRSALAGSGDSDVRSAVVRGANELFARGFEQYLAEGKAPSPGLRSVFQRFAAWLKEIYGKLTAKDRAFLSPEVREMMSRMVGTGEIEDKATSRRRTWHPDVARSKSVELDGKLYTVDEDVDMDDTVQVVPLEWKGLPKLPDGKRWMFQKSESLKGRIHEIVSTVMDKFFGGVRNAWDPDYVMSLSKENMDHIVNTAVMTEGVNGEVLMAALPRLDVLARRAYRVRTHEDRYESEGDVSRLLYNFFVPVEYEGRVYPLKMTVKELKNGVRELVGPLEVYDQTVKRKMPEASSPSFGSTSLSPETSVPTGKIVSVKDLIHDIKDPALGNIRRLFDMPMRESVVPQRISETVPAVTKSNGESVLMIDTEASKAKTHVAVSMRENMGRGLRAMKTVIERHEDVPDAMWREDLGSVSFVWGTPGKGERFKGGYGISHIIARRNAEGNDGEKVARKMVEVIAKGAVTRREGPEEGTRVTLSYDDHSAVLSLYRFGERQTWLLTGWSDSDIASDVSGKVYDSPGTTLSEPTRFQSGEGAEASERSIPSSPESVSGDYVLGQGVSDRSVKRQKALEHKAEERERAREFGNAPEDPFGGEPATEADIDDMFADGAWSLENMADMAREFDEAFYPRKEAVAKEKSQDIYDANGVLKKAGSANEDYVNPWDYYIASPSAVARHHPILRKFFDLAKQAMKLQEDLRREFGKVLDEAWGSLSESQSQRLNELLLDGDLQGKTFSEEELLSKGADEAVQKGYQAVRSLADRVGQTVRNRQRQNGNIVMGWRKGYVPHIFHAFWVQADEHTVATTRSLREAVELAKNFSNVHPGQDVRIVSKPNDMTGTSKFAASAVEDARLLRMSSRLEDVFSFTVEEAEGYLSGRDGGAFKNRIFKFAHERIGAPGWDRDMRFAFRHYMNQAARFLAMDELKARGTTLFENRWGNFDHEYTGMAKYAKDYLNDVLGVPTNAARTMNEFVKQIPGLNRVARLVFGDRPAESLAAVFTKYIAVAKLGFFNVGSALMNLSQLVNATAALGYDDVRLGIVEYFHPNDRTRRVYEETGVENDLNVSAGAGYSKASERVYGKLGDLAEATLAPFTFMDGMCRKTTVLAAYRQATRKGMSHEEAIAFARETNDRTNFDYSVADAPNFLRRSGPLGQVLFQFKKFGVKQLEFALGLKTVGERTRFWVPMIALSGLFGLPGTDLLVSLFRALFDRDPQLEINAWLAKNSSWISEPVRRTIQYGLLSNVGIDMSRRVGMGDVIPNQLSDLLGPAVGTVARMGGPAAILAGKLFGMDGDGTAALLNALEALSPGLSNPIKALLGEVADKNRGRLRFSYSGGERFVRAMGFRPTREAVESDAVRTARYVEQQRGDRERAAIDEYARARERNDDVGAARALEKVRALRIEPRRLIEELRMRRRGTAYDRMVQDLRSPRRREARDVLLNF